MRLPAYLSGLDFMSAKKSSEYVGTKVDNPAMILEESVAAWTKTTSWEEIVEALEIWQEKVCVQGFPARYSPQFWLAHAALSAIYSVLCGHLHGDQDPEMQTEVDGLLLQLWMKLISAGPGSTHLEMMAIILKNELTPLWRHMQMLRGDNLKLLLSTLKTDFVYVEEVPADHYATLMETHIDKIFRTILSHIQFEEAQRDMLDLQLFYLSRMNHVPPHIGPRLSHLCFLICSRYKLENPYIGMDDWVLTRHHLRLIKEVITDPTFTRASEAQYRAPITLEKIFQAAVLDGMLESVFRDFMSLLTTMCNYSNCRKCHRLFNVYQTGLFEQIDWKKGFEERPYWLFDAAMKAMILVAGTNSMEPHMDDFLVSTQNHCLMQFDQLTPNRLQSWHELLVSYVVSGRCVLTTEATSLLVSPLLERNTVLDWKKHVKEGKMLVDIVADLPETFVQDDEFSPLVRTVSAYVSFMKRLLEQMKNAGVIDEVQTTVERCVIHCLNKAPVTKAPIILTCLQSDMLSFQDVNFIREVLFGIDKLLKDTDGTAGDGTLSKALTYILSTFLQYFRDKGFVAIDFNTLLISICVTCVTSGGNNPTTSYQDESDDLWEQLYYNVLEPFIDMHIEKGSTRSLTPLVPDVLSAVKDSLQRGAGTGLLVTFLQKVETSCPQIIGDHVTTIVELYLDWECFNLKDFVEATYVRESGPLISRFQDIYEYVWESQVDQRHHVIYLLLLLSDGQSQLFTGQHVSQLLDTYYQETEISQSYILQIMANLAERVPALIRGHYASLTDDAQFSPMSLKARADIIVSISKDSEDLAKKTIDYLMKHTEARHVEVSTVAMESLVPLVKGSPFVHKNKQKFKTLHKSTTSTKIKDLCVQILPELRSLPGNKQPAVMKSKQVNTTEEAKKGVSSTKGKTTLRPVRQPPGMKPITIKVSSGTKADTKTKSLAVEVAHKDKSVIQASGDTNTVKQPRKGGQDDNTVTCEEVTNTVTQTETFAKSMNSFQTLKYDPSTQSDVLEKQRNKQNGDVVDTCLEGDDAPEVTENELSKRYIESDDGGSTIEYRKHIYTGDILEPIATQSKEENAYSEGNGDTYQGMDKDKSERSFSPSCFQSAKCTPLAIIMTSQNTRIDQLKEELSNSGFDSSVCRLADVKDIEYNFKLAIVCLTNASRRDHPELLQKVAVLKATSSPLLLLEFSDEGVPNDLTKDETYTTIRFFLKGGEKPYKDTSWSLKAFRELLMFINYYGIFPEETIKVQEISKLLQCEPVKDEHLDKVPVYASPNVFISYKWANQEEVEPLYNYLTELGFHCWFGAHQISGSESLYNKIAQGLHGCRAVIACVTAGYAQAANCQQEVTIAQNLSRPIIPLLLGNKLRWPPTGGVGPKLGNYGYYRVDVVVTGVDVTCAAFGKVLVSLDKFIPNVIDANSFGSQNNSLNQKETVTWQPNMKTKVSSDVNADNTEMKDVKHGQNTLIKAHLPKKKSLPVSSESNVVDNTKVLAGVHIRDLPKSSSMFEIEMAHREVAKEGMAYANKTDDDIIVKDRKRHGNAMHSTRSQSCLIL